jgi:CspA family cold shock protein
MLTDYENKTSPSQDTGTIKHWNADKGFGFAQRDGKPDIFIHIKDVSADVDELTIGQRVRFDVGMDHRSGKARAIDVQLID